MRHSSNTRSACPDALGILPLLLAAGMAAAQDAPPPPPPPEVATLAAEMIEANPGLDESALDELTLDPPQAATPGETAAEHAPARTPGLAIIARWIRSSGCRVVTRFPFDENTFVSLPEDRTLARGWRISIPSFANARVSFSAARPLSRDADAATMGATATDPASAPAPTAAAVPTETPQPTWTQKAGLVKAAAPASSGVASSTRKAKSADASEPN